jgi:hypothetical protein
LGAGVTPRLQRRSSVAQRHQTNDEKRKSVTETDHVNYYRVNGYPK